MWAQYNQQPPPSHHQMPPQGPPGGGGPPPPAQGGPPPGGYNNYSTNNYSGDHGHYDEQGGGSALTSAVDMVASAASGLFFSGGSKVAPAPPQQQQQQATPSPAFQSMPSPSQQPPQAFSQQFQQPPIQPTTSMLSTSPRSVSVNQNTNHPPPIQVTSSLLSTTPRRAPPPASTPSSAPRPNPIPVTSSLLTGSRPPTNTPLAAASSSISSGPPLAHQSAGQPTTAAVGPPLTTSSGPPTTFSAPPTPGGGPPTLASNNGPPVAAAAAGAPVGPPMAASAGPPLKASSASPLSVSTGPPVDAGSLVAGIPTPRGPSSVTSSHGTPPATPDPSPTVGRTIASSSPRSSSTKKLPLPPPSATLERRRRDKGKKFKLPPAFSTTTPRKKKEGGFALPPKTTDKPPTKATATPMTTSSINPTSAPATTKSTESSKAPPTSVTPCATETSKEESTPKRSNIGPSPVETKPAQPGPIQLDLVDPSAEAQAPSPAPAASMQQQSVPSTTAPETETTDPVQPVESQPSPEVIPATETAEPVLPSGWKEIMDPSSGRVYYWNEVDGSTSWERPVVQQEEVLKESSSAAEQPVSSQAAESANALPTEMDDMNNAVTSASSVQPEVSSTATPAEKEETTPSISAPSVVAPESAATAPPPQDQDIAADANVDQLTNPPETLPAAESEPSKVQPESTGANQSLPSGWIEMMDEASGRPYYVNTIDNSTSWDRPQPEEPQTESAEGSPNVTAEPENVAPEEAGGDEKVTQQAEQLTTGDDVAATDASTENTSPALPAGWIELIDEGSGRPYYVEQASGTTTWEKPAVAPSEPVVEERPETAGEEKESSPEPIADIQDVIDELAPEITQADKEGLLDQNPGDDVGVSSEAADTTMAILEDIQGSDALPEGWAEAVDPTSGRTYYVNELENITTWDRPGPPEEKSNELSIEAEAGLQDTEISDGPQQQSAPEVAGEKEEPESVAPEVTKTNEADALDGTPEEDVAEATGEEVDGGLPPGWIEVVDPSTGNPYYFNETTNESRWDKPSHVSKVTSDVDAPSGESGDAQTEDEVPSDANDFVLVQKDVPHPEGTTPELTNKVESEVTPEETENVALPEQETGKQDEATSTSQGLPPGWEECYDANSKMTYYYNAKEEKSTFQRPVSDPEPKAAVEPAPDAAKGEPVVQEEVTEEANEAPEVETNTDAIEDAALAGAGPDETNHTETPGVADKLTAANETEAPLPPGWVVVDDPSTGGVFYFNEIDKITSYERPSVLENEPKDEPPQKDQPMEPETETNKDDLPEAENPQDWNDLPPGWVELTDPSSGRVYYYNEAEGVSAWERPANSIEPEDVAAATPDLGTNSDEPEELETPSNDLQPEADQKGLQDISKEEGAAVEALATENNKSESDLPAGWEAIFDESSGRTYYYNHNDGSSSWERPALPEDVISPEAEEEDVQESPISPEAEADVAPPEVSPAQGEEELVSSEDAGVTDGIGTEAEASGEQANASETEDELPPGWTESIDPSTGNTFYYNAAENISSWERPTFPDNTDLISTEATETTAAVETPAEGAVPLDEDDQPGPEPNAESSAPLSTNEAEPAPGTNEADTAGLEATGDDTAKESSGQEDDLPEGWVAVVDPTSGNTYYLNELAGISSWERPAAPEPENQNEPPTDEASAEKALDKAGPEVEEEKLIQETDSAELDAGHGSVHAEPQGDLASAPADLAEHESSLPPGWQEVSDPTTGNVYYYNHNDGTTSWEKPMWSAGEEEVSSPAADPEGSDAFKVDPQSEAEILNAEGKESKPSDSVGIMGEEAEVPTQPEVVFDTPSEEISDELPPGWVEQFDEASARPFFYNESDGRTSWERPQVPSAMSKQVEMEPDSQPQAVEGEHSASVSAAEDKEGSPILENAREMESESQAMNLDVSPDDGQEQQLSEANGEDALGDANDLPPGWSEQTHPTTGKSYYYNEFDGTTTWERPMLPEQETTSKPPIEPQELPGVEEEIPLEKEDEPSSAPVESTTGQLQEMDVGGSAEDAQEQLPTETHGEDAPGDGVSDLPPGWLEQTDPTTGNSYYYNQNDGTTTWERPIGTEQEETNQAPADTQEAPAAENVEGQETVEKEEETPPAEEAIADQVQESDLGASADDSQQQQLTEVNGQVAPGDDVSDLPPGWVEQTDPTTGNLYYYNENDGTTTWERPIWPEDATNQAPTDTLEALGAEDDKLTVEKEDEPSPAPLESTSDQVQEVDLVGNEGDAGELVENSTEEPAQQESATTPLDEVVPTTDLPDGWTANLDPTSGNYYYLHTDGTSTWERPSMPAESEEAVTAEDPAADVKTDELIDGAHGAEQAQPEDGAEQAQTSTGEELVQSGLPPGWQEVVDESTGSTYYYNHNDNTTSWEPPAWPVDENAIASGDEALPGEAQQAGVVQEEDQKVLDEGAPPPSSELPGSDVIGEGTEAVEELDDQAAPPTLEVETEGAAAEVGLPPGWIEQIDPQSGRPYYYNEVDNITSWEKPIIETQDKPEVVVAEGESGNVAEPAEEASIPKDDSVAQVVVEDEPETTVPDNGTTADGLPDGWKEQFDESSGRPYFINLATNETTWDRPCSKPINEGAKVAPDVVPDNTLPEGWEEMQDPTGQVYYVNHTLGTTQWERPTADPTSKPEPSVVDSGSTGTSNAPGSGGGRRRPPHAIATFGFGGRLCVFRATNRSQVEVYRINKLLPSHDLVKIEASKARAGISGPLNTANTESVRDYVKRTTEERSKDLLWHLIHIVSKSKGRIRSQSAMADANSPEAAIVDLMLGDGVKPVLTPQNGGTNGNSRLNEGDQSENGAKAGMEEIQNFILRGKRAEAVEVALESNNFALALLVSTFCDPQTYHHVVKQYAEKVLQGGSPLHTIAMLFSGQIGTSLWSANSKDLLGSWRCHLAALISNRISGWDRIVVALGCKLAELGDIHAAHVCFMVSGLQLMSPILDETYMSLLGCDHLIPENISFMTKEGIEAYARTEAYEWAKRRGNPNALIRTLQPFKLQYAILLADLGFIELAKKYLENILVMVELAGDDSRFDNYVAARWTLPEMCESPDAFRSALASFEQRLFQNIPDETVERSAPKKAALAPPNGLPDPTEEFPSISQAPTVDSEVSFMTAHTTHLPDPTTASPTLQQSKPKEKVKSKPAPSKIARKRNNKKDVKAEESVAKTPKDANEKRGRGPEKIVAPMSGPPTTPAAASAPPTQSKPPQTDKPKGPTLKDSKKPAAAKKPEPAPKSAPAVMVQKRDWTFGMAGRMQKWLNPEATTADLGEGMQAYYCPEKKVWVFPGEDPAEVAKPLPPPPTPAEMAPKEEPKPEPDMATDPLAAMMAPPKRTPASFGRSRPGGAPGGMPATPRSLYPGMPPMPGVAASPAGGPAGGGAPPQFMVFQPSPKPKEKKEEEGKAEE